MFKRILFSLFVVAATVATVVSCSKEDVYSCDPVVNQWTKSNLTSIKTMTRSNWRAVANKPRQRAIYEAFTAEQRINLWVGKMNETLTLDWSADERSHIESLLTIINNNQVMFGGKEEQATDEERNQFDLAMYEWKEYAETTLGWSKKLVTNIIYTPETIADKQGNLAFVPMAANLMSDPSEGGDGYTKYCDCSTIDYDGSCPGGCHENASCTDTKTGCGMLWVNKCTGLCS